MRIYWVELKKIIRIIINDPRSLIAGIIPPSLVLILFYLLFGELSSMPIGIINEDQGIWGQRLEQEILEQISPLGDGPYFVNRETDYKKAIQEYNKGNLVGIIVIPEDFSMRMTNEDNPEIKYHLNNLNTDFAKNMRLYLQEGIFSFYKKYYNDVKVELTEIVSAPAQVEWVDIIATGTMLLAFVIGGMFNYLYVFFKEKKYETILLYGISPRSPIPSFLARITASLGSSILAGFVNILLIYLILDFKILNYFSIIGPALLLSVVIYICAAAVFSMYVNSFYGAVLGAMGGTMVFWFFSGGLSMLVPEKLLLQIFYRGLPNSYTLDIIRGSIFGSHTMSYAFNYLILSGMAALLLGWAVYLYRSRMWKRPRF